MSHHTIAVPLADASGHVSDEAKRDFIITLYNETQSHMARRAVSTKANIRAQVDKLKKDTQEFVHFWQAQKRTAQARHDQATVQQCDRALQQLRTAFDAQYKKHQEDFASNSNPKKIVDDFFSDLSK